VGAAHSAPAVEIDGVQPLAFDQPQVNVALQPDAGGSPYGFSFGGFSTFNITAYLDTGASGVVISSSTAEGFAVPIQPGVTYSDVAVGGTTDFSVSTPLRVRVAPSNSLTIDDPNPTTFNNTYNQIFSTTRLQVGPTLTNVPDEELSFPLDVVGMPAMVGKVVVMDPKPLNNQSGDIFDFSFMNTYIYNPTETFHSGTQTTNPGIPTTSHHVQLSHGDFGRFTTTSPDGASPPTIADNPFIGPNPVAKFLGNPATTPPPVSIDFNGHHTQGSFLLDTGAAVSFISTELAKNLHVRVAANPIDQNHLLESYVNESDPSGTPIATFTLPLQGLGGQANPMGFFLDDLILHTIEGSALDANANNIKFLHAPVFIQDIELRDPLNPDEQTNKLLLDGVFGMNFMVASGMLVITGDSFDITAASTGPFNWVTFDQPNGILGLDLAAVPEPGSVALAASGAAILLGYLWRRRRARLNSAA
jgi:hypothetical protein